MQHCTVCVWYWEERLLEYFGAGVTEERASADFHKFQFAAADDKTPDYEYYNQMCFFLQHNFRNAILAFHYKLFDAGAPRGYFQEHNGVTGLQAAARKVYDRERSLLNNRSSFVGLGNVSAGLNVNHQGKTADIFIPKKV